MFCLGFSEDCLIVKVAIETAPEVGTKKRRGSSPDNGSCLYDTGLDGSTMCLAMERHKAWLVSGVRGAGGTYR